MTEDHQFLEELILLAAQYRDDLRHPPSPDSVKRRLDLIESVLSRAQKRWKIIEELESTRSSAAMHMRAHGLDKTQIDEKLAFIDQFIAKFKEVFE